MRKQHIFLKGVNPLRLIIRYRELGHAKAFSVAIKSSTHNYKRENVIAERTKNDFQPVSCKP